jgi:hypothetical protein
MDFEDEEFEWVLKQLQSKGVWLQGNLRCLTGAEGARPRQRIEQLLSENGYRFLATDMHGPSDLAERLSGLEIVQERIGAMAVWSMMVERPARLLTEVSTRGAAVQGVTAPAEPLTHVRMDGRAHIVDRAPTPKAVT